MGAESSIGLGGAVAGTLAALPAVIDPMAPRGEFAVVADGMGQLAVLIERIGESQKDDLRRVSELVERPQLTLSERDEALHCVARLLDGERDLDRVRGWWDANQGPIAALAARMGSDDLAFVASLRHLPLPAERAELRATLRRAQEQLHGTPVQRLKWHTAGRLAAFLLLRAARLRQLADDAPDNSD